MHMAQGLTDLMQGIAIVALGISVLILALRTR